LIFWLKQKKRYKINGFTGNSDCFLKGRHKGKVGGGITKIVKNGFKIKCFEN